MTGSNWVTKVIYPGMVFVFFIYGLAFYSMGLALLLESQRLPALAGGRVLRPLAAFGFIHGTHEWLEMILESSAWQPVGLLPLVGWLRVGLLVGSFSALLLFGAGLLAGGPRPAWVLAGFLGLYALLALLAGMVYNPLPVDWDHLFDTLARYILAVPGALLAGLALYRQGSQAKGAGDRALAASLQWTAAGFVLYALTQSVAPPATLFPASVWNTAVFLQVSGLPIQVIRALLAGGITAGMIHAVQVTEAGRQRELAAAQQARLDALAQAQQELLARESLRRELLRHTVLAQEEERSRIARELHDETAQMLTAFSLHLAALQQGSRPNPRLTESLTFLQKLCRQMADGIYRLVHDLRPAQLDDLGLAAALQHLAGEMQGQGVKVDLQINGPRQRLDPLLETVLFRVAQEALTNVRRHAAAGQASLEVEFAAGQIVLRVCDDGRGFDPQAQLVPPSGWGLAGMRERVQAVGGTFTLRSAPGQGTIIDVTAPVEER